MADSGHPGGPTNGDWWELTNTGAGAVDLSGYSWDDDSQDPTLQTFVAGVTIAPGESLIVLDEDALADGAAFRATWGLAAGVQVLTYDDFVVEMDFAGLGDGDEVNLYDAADALVAQATYGAGVRSTGASLFYDPTTGSLLGTSLAGVAGAVTSADGDVGSPGTAVPEPGAALLLGLGVLGALRGRAGASRPLTRLGA
jgi:hypothetical protein